MAALPIRLMITERVVNFIIGFILLLIGLYFSLFHNPISDSLVNLIFLIYFMSFPFLSTSTFGVRHNWIFLIISSLFFMLLQIFIIIPYTFDYRLILTIFLMYYTIPLYIFPLLFHILYSRILIIYPNFSNIFNPINNDELYREDSILIDVLAFFQAILFIYGVIKDFEIYQYIALVGIIGFIFPRIIGHIRNNNLCRYYSSLFFILFILVDIFMLVFKPIPESPMIQLIKEKLKVQFDWILFIILGCIILMILSFFNNLLRHRYSINDSR